MTRFLIFGAIFLQATMVMAQPNVKVDLRQLQIAGIVYSSTERKALVGVLEPTSQQFGFVKCDVISSKKDAEFQNCVYAFRATIAPTQENLSRLQFQFEHSVQTGYLWAQMVSAPGWRETAEAGFLVGVVAGIAYKSPSAAILIGAGILYEQAHAAPKFPATTPVPAAALNSILRIFSDSGARFVALPTNDKFLNLALVEAALDFAFQQLRSN